MFSLNMSHPPRMVTQHRPGFLAAHPKSYASRADELHSRIHNNGRSIAQNSAIKPSEQLSNKQKRDADIECHSRPSFPGPDPDPTLWGSGIGTNIHFPMRVGKWMGIPAGPNGSPLGRDCRELGPRQNSRNSRQSHNIALHTNITQL